MLYHMFSLNQQTFSKLSHIHTCLSYLLNSSLLIDTFPAWLKAILYFPVFLIVISYILLNGILPNTFQDTLIPLHFLHSLFLPVHLYRRTIMMFFQLSALSVIHRQKKTRCSAFLCTNHIHILSFLSLHHLTCSFTIFQLSHSIYDFHLLTFSWTLTL